MENENGELLASSVVANVYHSDDVFMITLSLSLLGSILFLLYFTLKNQEKSRGVLQWVEAEGGPVIERKLGIEYVFSNMNRSHDQFVGLPDGACIPKQEQMKNCHPCSVNRRVTLEGIDYF